MTNRLLIQLGTISGSLMAILGLFWFIGEPALERYVEAQIQLHEDNRKQEPSGVKLRELLGYKMGVANDEVHIEIGRQYKHQKMLVNEVDSISKIVFELNDFKKMVEKEFDYYHPDNLLNGN